MSSVCCTACSLWLPYDLPEEDCFTSADEDGDGFGRCVDLDCDGSCDETITNGICGDLRDNDGDGLTDILDPGCWRSSIQTCGSVEGTSLSAVATEDPQSWRGPVAAAPPDGVRRPLRSVIPGEPLVLFERLFGQLRGTRLALDVLLRTGASVEVALVAALEEQTRPPTFRVRLDGDGSVELEIAQAALVRRTDLDGVAFFAPGDWTRIELEIVEESGSGFAVVRVDGSEARRLPFDAFLVGTTSGYDLSLRSGWPPEASAPLFAGLEVERPSDQPCGVEMPLPGAPDGLLPWSAVAGRAVLEPTGDSVPPLCVILAARDGSSPMSLFVEEGLGATTTAEAPELSSPVVTYQADPEVADGRYVVSGLEGGRVMLYESADCVEWRRMGGAFTPDTEPSAEHQLLAANVVGSEIRLWFLRGGEVLAARAREPWVEGLRMDSLATARTQSVVTSFTRPAYTITAFVGTFVSVDARNADVSGAATVVRGALRQLQGSSLATLRPSAAPVFDRHSIGPGAVVVGGRLVGGASATLVHLVYTGRSCDGCPLKLGVARLLTN